MVEKMEDERIPVCSNRYRWAMAAQPRFGLRHFAENDEGAPERDRRGSENDEYDHPRSRGYCRFQFVNEERFRCGARRQS